MNKFNPEAIVCADFSIDVILFNRDLTPEECSADMEPPRRDGVPITNDGYLLSAYSYESLDAFENYMSGVKYAPSIIGEDGLALPPLPIHDDIEDIPF